MTADVRLFGKVGIFTSATSPSALWVEKKGAQRDELHRWPAILFRPSERSVPERIEALFRSRAILYLHGATGSRGEAKPSA